MKLIPLSRGLFAQVEDADFEYLNKWRWHATRSNASRTFYAARKSQKHEVGARQSILMHRVILKTPAHLEVDHEDGNGLNNQLYNIKNCTHAVNKANVPRKQFNNSTGHTGVAKSKQGRWTASVTRYGSHFSLGTYDTREEAALARAAYEDAGTIPDKRPMVVRVTSQSGIKGVGLMKSGRWRAYYTKEGKRVNIGCFGTKEEAAEAVDLIRKQL